MEPQTSLKIIGKNTEYTQNNHKDLDKILKDRLGSLKIFAKIIEDPYRSLVKFIKIYKGLNKILKGSFKIIKILEDFFLNSLITFRKDPQRS